MADNKKRDPVEEQRARQRELIELKRQKEAFRENPKEYKSSGDSAVFVQSRKSKLQNFWYYSRFTIIGLLVVAVIIGIGISSCVGKTDYDLTVVLYTKTFVSDTMSTNIATIMKEYCEDFNGDGEVNVLVVNCSIPNKLTAEGSESTTRLLGQFQNEEAVCYIVDTDAYNDLKENFGQDFLYDGMQLSDLDGTAFKLNGTVFDAAFDAVSEGYTDNFDYYLLRRNISETSTANKKDVAKHVKNAEKVIRAVVADPYFTFKGELIAPSQSEINDSSTEQTSSQTDGTASATESEVSSEKE